MEPIMEVLAEMGAMNFADFMRTALYHPGLGYYARRDRTRVGTRSDADFYTAESIGPVFSRLAVDAAWDVAAPFRTRDVTFVEMGAEPGSPDVASHASPPFPASVALPRGESLPENVPLVVFSNELFDAQPFYRIVRADGRWRECGVEVRDGKAVEILLDEPGAPVAAVVDRLPDDAPDGYRMDLPLEAESLMRDIASRRNVEAVIAFDYGLDLDDIQYRRPDGTARAYRHHKLAGSLLDCPGDQDLTCHICWDVLENILRDCGFSHVSTVRQESFFVRHAMTAIAEVMRRGDPVESGKLRELIHPTLMGGVFQTLVAVRK